MADRDFFSSLRERLESRPGDDFDRGFWAKFDTEFGGPRRRNYRVSGWLQWLVPMAAGAVLILVVSNVFLSTSRQFVADRQALGPVLENAAMLEDLDLFLGDPDEDVASLSEEEWKILLNERSG